MSASWAGWRWIARTSSASSQPCFWSTASGTPLPHVVKEGRELDDVLHLGRQAHLVRDRERVRGDAVRVPAGGWVASLHGRHEGAIRPDEEFLEPREEARPLHGQTRLGPERRHQLEVLVVERAGGVRRVPVEDAQDGVLPQSGYLRSDDRAGGSDRPRVVGWSSLEAGLGTAGTPRSGSV